VLRGIKGHFGRRVKKRNIGTKVRAGSWVGKERAGEKETNDPRTLVIWTVGIVPRGSVSEIAGCGLLGKAKFDACRQTATPLKLRSMESEKEKGAREGVT